VNISTCLRLAESVAGFSPHKYSYLTSVANILLKMAPSHPSVNHNGPPTRRVSNDAGEECQPRRNVTEEKRDGAGSASTRSETSHRSSRNEKIMEAGQATPPGADSMQRKEGARASSPATSSSASSIEGRRPSFMSLTVRFLTWAPKRCRWDPGTPPRFSVGLNILYAFVSFHSI